MSELERLIATIDSVSVSATIRYSKTFFADRELEQNPVIKNDLKTVADGKKYMGLKTIIMPPQVAEISWIKNYVANPSNGIIICKNKNRTRVEICG